MKTDSELLEDTVLVEALLCKVVHVGENKNINDFVKRYSPAHPKEAANAASLTLIYSNDELVIVWDDESGQTLRLKSELIDQLDRLKSFPAAKQGAFNQALGRKSKVVLDATGGWGHDALLMAMQGYKVTIVERNPIMALILRCALEKIYMANRFANSGLCVPRLIEKDARDLTAVELSQFDCVYLDPMFPEKRKKSAKPVKRMQFLQWLLGEEFDASLLAISIRESGARRIAVKRPDYAASLIEKPHQQFSSKLVHYDVYLAS